MSKLRTLEQLEESLDKDYAWRRKELSFVVSNVKSSSGPALQTALRSGIALLYAHWEGFIKNAAVCYLTFVANKRLKYEELNNCFIAVSFKSKLSLCQASNKATIHTQMVDFFINHLSKTADIPYENVIKAGSNLNSEILREILTTIGLDYSPYELKAKLIDAELLGKRNNIAHGEYLAINEKEFSHLYKEITDMMCDIKTRISNAASLEKYKKAL